MRSQRLCGLKFRRQHAIGPFIVDFCCPASCVVVEVDGATHAGQAEYDAERTAWLNAQGYRVMRFSNDDVYRHLDGVLESIRLECQESRPRCEEN